MNTTLSGKTSTPSLGRKLAMGLGGVALAGMISLGGVTSANAAPVSTGVTQTQITVANQVNAIAPAANSSEQAKQNLTTQVRNTVLNKTYETSGGGSLKGSELLVKQADKTYDLDKAAYESLSSKGKDQLSNDILSASQSAVDNPKNTGITKDTQVNWLRDLQKNPGFGTKILNQTLEQVGPDFVSANKILAPIAPVISIVMGVGAILIMMFVGITIVCDIAYITIPMFRLFMGDEAGSGGGNGHGMGAKVGSKLVSAEAKHAVQESEGNGKSGLGKYFKARVFALILLGLCLVYLIQGQIYVLVGMLLDLLNGAVGF